MLKAGSDGSFGRPWEKKGQPKGGTDEKSGWDWRKSEVPDCLDAAQIVSPIEGVKNPSAPSCAGGRKNVE